MKVLPQEPMSGVIVVVEDPFVTSFIRTLLAKYGFRVVPAEALRGLVLLRTTAIVVDLLITNTPAMFAEVGGRIPLLYLAACPDPEQVSAFHTCRTLRKPFTPCQLLDAVAGLFVPAPAVK